MKILRASAGSGKTYQLSHTYLDRLLESGDPNAYRHILAVTFTNKATAEMKARILRDLAGEAESDGRARRVLRELLHDYSAFSISTIDRFFQQALKVFARETGQFADYQVELDRNSLIEESVDRILDSLSEESVLLDWIRESMRDSLELGSRFSITNGLTEIGIQVLNDEFRDLSRRMGTSAEELFSWQRLKELHLRCRTVIQDFDRQAKALGLTVKAGEKTEWDGNRNIIKKNPALLDLFQNSYARYATAHKIDALIYRMGIAGEIVRVFNDLAREKNVMCLNRSSMRRWASVTTTSCWMSSRIPPTSSGIISCPCSGRAIPGADTAWSWAM